MERKALVLDSSVIIKWFTQEENRDEAIQIREKFVNGEIEIAVPDLILYEIANALRFNPNFNSKDVEEAIESISGMDLNIIVPLSSTIKKAIDFAFSKNITIYDAFYISLASELEFTFVTADRDLYNKLKDLNFISLLGEKS